MIPGAVIDQISEAVSNILPKGVADDVRKQLDAVLAARLEQLGLVSREEFEVQQALLARMRERLNALEAEVAELQKGSAD